MAAAIATVAVAAVLRLASWEWCVLLLCVGVVLAAELLNTALESLARAVTRSYDPFVRDALDAAAGAVLLLAGTAAVVGLIVVVPHLGELGRLWTRTTDAGGG